MFYRIDCYSKDDLRSFFLHLSELLAYCCYVYSLFSSLLCLSLVLVMLRPSISNMVLMRRSAWVLADWTMNKEWFLFCCRLYRNHSFSSLQTMSVFVLKLCRFISMILCFVCWLGLLLLSWERDISFGGCYKSDHGIFALEIGHRMHREQNKKHSFISINLLGETTHFTLIN